MTDSTIFIFLSFAGSLAIIVLGLRMLNDRILLSYGSRIRNLLVKIGNRPLLAAGTGAFIAAGFQSFPAITVLLMSLIHASSISTGTAFAIAIGAGFGQVLPFWILTIGGFMTNATDWALPGMALAILLSVTHKRQLARLGIGLTSLLLVLIGIGFLKNLLPETSEASRILFIVRSLRDMPILFSLLGFSIGVVLSFLTQSSNAVLVTALCFSWTGWTSLPPVLAMMFGADVGIVLTLFRASGVYDSNSRIFSFALIIRILIAALAGLFLVYPLESLTSILFPNTYFRATHIPFILTSIYTIWSLLIGGTALSLRSGFISAGSTIQAILGRNKPSGDLPVIPRSLPDSLEANLITTRNEIGQTADITHQMLMLVLNASQEIESTRTYTEQIFELYTNLNLTKDQVTRFLTYSVREPTGADQARDITAQMRINLEIFKIGESCVNVASTLERICRKKYQIHEDALDDLYSFIAQVLDFLKYNSDCLVRKLTSYDSELAVEMEENVIRVRDKLRKRVRHTLERDEDADIRGELQYMEIVHYLEHIGDSCLSISKEIPGLR